MAQASAVPLAACTTAETPAGYASTCDLNEEEVACTYDAANDAMACDFLPLKACEDSVMAAVVQLDDQDLDRIHAFGSCRKGGQVATFCCVHDQSGGSSPVRELRVDGSEGADVIELQVASLGRRLEAVYQALKTVLHGHGGADLLRGTSDPDTTDDLVGGDGPDELRGLAGDDQLFGGDGADKLFGGPGADTLYGEAGADELEGGADDDVLWGGPGDDWLWGGAGDDVLHGGADDDRLYGGPDNDDLRGNNGDDILCEDNLLSSGTGYAHNDLRGGNGHDEVTYDATSSNGDVDGNNSVEVVYDVHAGGRQDWGQVLYSGSPIITPGQGHAECTSMSRFPPQ